jgi:hypothetical protein
VLNLAPVDEPQGTAELIGHLERITRLSRREIVKVLSEALAFFDEPVDEFVARRHAEMQADGLKNDAIFPRLADEVRARRFAPPDLSARQLRRLVYG